MNIAAESSKGIVLEIAVESQFQVSAVESSPVARLLTKSSLVAVASATEVRQVDIESRILAQVASSLVQMNGAAVDSDFRWNVTWFIICREFPLTIRIVRVRLRIVRAQDLVMVFDSI